MNTFLLGKSRWLSRFTVSLHDDSWTLFTFRTKREREREREREKKLLQQQQQEQQQQQRYSRMMVSNRGKTNITTKLPLLVVTFIAGCIMTMTIVLNVLTVSYTESPWTTMTTRRNELPSGLNVQSGQQVFDVQSSSASFSSHTHGPLNGIRILIVIAAYDFSQLPHLEEILDTYQDLRKTIDERRNDPLPVSSTS